MMEMAKATSLNFVVSNSRELIMEPLLFFSKRFAIKINYLLSTMSNYRQKGTCAHPKRLMAPNNAIFFT